MKDSFGGHVVVHHFRNRELEQRQENSLGSVSEIIVFHWRTADDRRCIDWVPAHRQSSDVNLRVKIGLGIETGVISEWPLDYQRLRRIDVTLDRELRLGRNL